MRKLIAIFLFILLAALMSCKKEEINPAQSVEPVPLPTTYQIKNTAGMGVYYNLIVFGYIGNDLMEETFFGHIDDGEITQKVETKAEKIRVSIELSEGYRRYYSIRYLYLDAGRNNIFDITATTKFQEKL